MTRDDTPLFRALQAIHARAAPVSPVWEPPDVEQTLAMLTQAGVVTQTWDALAGACAELCLPNDGQTVPVGQPFKTGTRIAKGHPNCQCGVIYRDAAGTIVKLTQEVSD